MKWLECVQGKDALGQADASALDSVRLVLASLSADQLRAAFHSSDTDRASLSQAIVHVAKTMLVSRGWDDKAHHGVKRLPASHDLRMGSVALRFGFQHEAAVLRNLLMPSIEASGVSSAKASAGEKWTSLIIVAATDDFRKLAGMNSAVGTFEDYEVCLRACETFVRVPVVVLGLTGSDDLRVVHERDYKGRKRGYVETDQE